MAESIRWVNVRGEVKAPCADTRLPTRRSRMSASTLKRPDAWLRSRQRAGTERISPQRRSERVRDQPTTSNAQRPSHSATTGNELAKRAPWRKTSAVHIRQNKTGRPLAPEPGSEARQASTRWHQRNATAQTGGAVGAKPGGSVSTPAQAAGSGQSYAVTASFFAA